MSQSPAAGPLIILSLLGIAAGGCNRSPPDGPPSQPPAVQVSVPVAREITDFEDFIGRTETAAGIEVRARVSGYLDKVLFKEGTEVRQGDPLFEIDRRTYQADFDKAEANVLLAKAHLNRLEADFKRASKLLPSQAISREEFDKVGGDRAEAEAALHVAEAARNLYRLNLDFTLVKAPISGRISRQLIDPGNLVKADDTVLTTIVSLDPIYAYFDVDERSMLRIRRLVRAGKLPSSQEDGVPVLMGLSDEEGFSHSGRVNFVENRLDALSGTLRMRGVFSNPKRLLSPSMFVRVRIPIGTPHRAILVSERALGSDQGQRFVYVVNDKGEVAYRRVEVGALDGGLRVIDSGLAMGDRVIVSGLQRVRPGVKVDAKVVAMTEKEASVAASPRAAGEAPPAPEPAAKTLGAAHDRPTM